MMVGYFKTISESEAFYSINEDGKIIESGGGQSSYNLPRRFFEYVRKNNVLMPNSDLPYARKDIDGPAYVLHDDYEFKLGPGALSLIGEYYGKIENKFIASLNGTNNKFQIYRKVYDELGSQYGWFTRLYDRNLSGNKLLLKIDEKNKIFILDIRFELISENAFLKYINKSHI